MQLTDRVFHLFDLANILAPKAFSIRMCCIKWANTARFDETRIMHYTGPVILSATCHCRANGT